MNKPDWALEQAETRKRLSTVRQIAGADVLSHVVPHNSFSPYQHRAVEGSGYVAREGEPFVRRAVAKVKGKAAKKAAKKARHQLRARIGNATQQPPERIHGEDVDAVEGGVPEGPGEAAQE